jgi:Secretion system C-terminal sorting domain/Fibronectin type III domain/Carbohydrate binding domain
LECKISLLNLTLKLITLKLMKKILLLSFLVLGITSANAQGSCANAIDITANGTITVPAVVGTLEEICYPGTTTSPDNSNPNAPMSGIWYKYTPASSGIVAINSNLPTNVPPLSNDTKVSIGTGTCGALECYTANDDVSGTNYLSSVSFPVAALTTYYIQWDDFWNGSGFTFTFTFTPVACLPPNSISAPTNITTTTATLNWTASISTPSNGYDVEYGPVGFTQGNGTTVNSGAGNTFVNLTGLTPSTVYDYYVRANCGTSQSTWSDVDSFTTVKILPYLSGLDDSTQLAGWTISGNSATQGLGNNATAAQTPNGYWIFNTAAAPGPSNNWLYSPGISLQTNEQVTISFWHRASATARTLRVTVGQAASEVGQQTVLLAASIPIANPATTWTQVTVPVFTAPLAGIYYFGFNDNTTATPTTASTMRIDTFSFTTNLGTNEYLSSSFSVYPNPVNNVINFTNNANAIVSSVELTDMNGRIVKSAEVNATEGELSVSDLSSGIYMMRLTSDQGVATKKIIKE